MLSPHIFSLFHLSFLPSLSIYFTCSQHPHTSIEKFMQNIFFFTYWRTYHNFMSLSYPWQYLGSRLHPLIRVTWSVPRLTETLTHHPCYKANPSSLLSANNQFPPSFFPPLSGPKNQEFETNNISWQLFIQRVHPLSTSMLKVRQSKQTCSLSV